MFGAPVRFKIYAPANVSISSPTYYDEDELEHSKAEVTKKIFE